MRVNFGRRVPSYTYVYSGSRNRLANPWPASRAPLARGGIGARFLGQRPHWAISGTLCCPYRMPSPVARTRGTWKRSHWHAARMRWRQQKRLSIMIDSLSMGGRRVVG